MYFHLILCIFLADKTCVYCQYLFFVSICLPIFSAVYFFIMVLFVHIDVILLLIFIENYEQFAWTYLETAFWSLTSDPNSNRKIKGSVAITFVRHSTGNVNKSTVINHCNDLHLTSLLYWARRWNGSFRHAFAEFLIIKVVPCFEASTCLVLASLQIPRIARRRTGHSA
jgi:hypothetical protein